MDLSEFLPNTREANPVPEPSGLACSWGDAATGLTRIAVYISAVADIDDKIRRLRDKVAEFSLDADHHHDPMSAREEQAADPDVHVFVFGYSGNVEVLVGHCDVTVAALNPVVDLDDMIGPAVEIAGTVGCSPYEDDFVRPDYPEAWQRQRLVSPPFPPMGKPSE